MQSLRGRHEPCGLGSRPGVLCPLRGSDGRNRKARAGEAELAPATIGTGAGLETSGSPCVVRWRSWRPWWRRDAPDSAWEFHGICPKWEFWRLPPQPFGGRSSDIVKDEVANNDANIAKRVRRKIKRSYFARLD